MYACFMSLCHVQLVSLISCLRVVFIATVKAVAAHHAGAPSRIRSATCCWILELFALFAVVGKATVRVALFVY